MRVILGILLFYGRFGFSFSAIGYHARRLFWNEKSRALAGQTILVTGASGGIGAAVVEGCCAAGATVIAVARNPEKLQSLCDGIEGTCDTRVCNLADSSQVRQLVDDLIAEGIRIDVLVNNVGVMLHDYQQNNDGVDTQFATNLLNQYVLTEKSIVDDLLATNGVVISVASGGMYMAPLVLSALASDTAEGHDGTRAYAIQKRAQVVLTQHWREHNAEPRRFYVMHPGWVDTDGVKRSLPTFRKLLSPILRTAQQGADTIIWLAAEKPDNSDGDSIWLDRKARKTHAYGFTRTRSETTEALLNHLKRFL